MKIKFLTTGGTIDKVYFDAKSEFQVGSPLVLEVLQDANVTFEYEIESLLRKDSLDMNDEDRQFIRRRVEAEACARIVITHGTDTLIETALALAGILGKTIVLTGSMQPARFRTTDAVFNIGAAIGSVQRLFPGVYIAMNGQVFDPQRTRKNREKNCFEVVRESGIGSGPFEPESLKLASTRRTCKQSRAKHGAFGRPPYGNYRAVIAKRT